MKVTVANNEVQTDIDVKSLKQGELFLLDKAVYLMCSDRLLKDRLLVVDMESGEMVSIDGDMRVQKMRQIEPLALAA